MVIGLQRTKVYKNLAKVYKNLAKVYKNLAKVTAQKGYTFSENNGGQL